MERDESEPQPLDDCEPRLPLDVGLRHPTMVRDIYMIARRELQRTIEGDNDE